MVNNNEFLPNWIYLYVIPIPREGHRIPNSVTESIVSGAKFLYKNNLVRNSATSIITVNKIKEAGVTPDTITSVSNVFDGETQYTNIIYINFIKRMIAYTQE